MRFLLVLLLLYILFHLLFLLFEGLLAPFLLLNLPDQLRRELQRAFLDGSIHCIQHALLQAFGALFSALFQIVEKFQTFLMDVICF